MILYFSGTGNSAYAAERIGKEIQDETLNLFEKIRNKDFAELYSNKPWIVVTPTYAWRIPRILQDWLLKTNLRGNKNIYFVMTCGGSIGNAGSYVKNLASSKSMNCLGCVPVVMPENYIALFHTPTPEESFEIIQRGEKTLKQISKMIREEKSYVTSAITLKDKISSGIVNDIFYPAIVHAKKFYVTDACISCGKCVKVCPLNNIHLASGKPVWDKNCTHCMACICRCPKEAIEYGKNSKGQVRYVCPKEL